MKYFRKFNSLSEANNAGAAGLESPHIDMVVVDSTTVGYNTVDTDAEKFSCTFNSQGLAENISPITVMYQVTLIAGTGGTVSGSGTYAYGTSVTINATPNDGYKFSQWSDGNTAATRTILINSNITLSASFKVSTLPEGYQLVEYLQSTGEQYINTDIKLTATTTNYEVVCEWQCLSSGSNTAPYGYYFTKSTYRNACQFRPYYRSASTDSRFQLTSFNSQSNQIIAGSTSTYLSRHILKCANNNVYVGETNVLTGSAANGTMNCLLTADGSIKRYSIFYLFASSSNNETSGSGCALDLIGSVKIWNFSMKVNDTYIRKMYPCYRISDNKPGMYDTVNKVFYVNVASGTDFTVGPDVEE